MPKSEKARVRLKDLPPGHLKDNLHKWTRHRETFGVPPHDVLTLFEERMRDAPDTVLECSCKVGPAGVHASRFNLWYKDLTSRIPADIVFGFLDEVSARAGVELDRGIADDIFDPSFAWSSVKQVILGVDLRDEAAQCRVKAWTVMHGNADKERALAAHHRFHPAVADLLGRGEELLFGFDFRFDGVTSVKAYPVVFKRDVVADRLPDPLRRALCPRTVALMRACHWAHLSSTTANDDLVVHFVPEDPDDFVRRPPICVLSTPIDRLGAPLQIVSVSDAQIRADQIREANLYY